LCLISHNSAGDGFCQRGRKSGKLIFLKTIEVSEREWDVIERKVRPKTQTIGHSGFMTFVRKIGA
jgi:tRNA (adenine57-N1/adenine58-N1)-methyltransferase